jgi:hypothetical protein
MNLTANNPPSWLLTIWEALWAAQDREAYTAAQWDDICTAMAWMTEAAGIEEEADA